ncbi:predicted protein [Uncinocarpus reesii 1704]|uniref:Uncharacterized protein n=1 Tax=Uncinocarpus reesii (strain UAMH 1704) TaxID=336963 RepID=C4JNW7_UNCRE|nr:uncharacterized protein UREG_04437 [Uncinocarpus reesii 1704]EEP79591.1 predicted protein [Uncinocarpus reesii 1704]
MSLPRMSRLGDIEWLSGFRPSKRLLDSLARCPLETLTLNAGLMLGYHSQADVHLHESFEFSKFDWNRIQALHLFNLNDSESVRLISRVIRHAGDQLKDLKLHFSLPFPRDSEVPNTFQYAAIAPVFDELSQGLQPKQLETLGIYECGEVNLASLFDVFDFSTIKHFIFMPQCSHYEVPSLVWSELQKREVSFETVMVDEEGEGMLACLSSFKGLRQLFVQYITTNFEIAPLCARNWGSLKTVFLPHGQDSMPDVEILLNNCECLQELGVTLYTSSMHQLFKLLDQTRTLKSLYFYTSCIRPNLPGTGPEISPKTFIKRFVDYFARGQRRRRPQNFSFFYHNLKRVSFHDALWAMMPTCDNSVDGSLFDYISRNNHPKKIPIHDTEIISTVKAANQLVLSELRGKGVALVPVRVPWSRHRGDKTLERLIDYLITSHPGRAA